MQTKLIIAGVGAASAAVGAVVGWAITADRYETQLKIADRVIERHEKKIYQLQNPDLITYAEADAKLMEMVLSDKAGLKGLVTAEDGTMMVSELQVTETSADIIARMKAEAEAEHPEKFLDEEVVEEALTEGDRTAYEKAKELIQEASADDYEQDVEVVPPNETVEETRSNLQSIIAQYVAKDEDAGTFSEFVANTADTDGVSYLPPFVISQDKYAWDEEGDAYSKITLTYFEGARVLLDDQEEQIEDVNTTVGWRNLKQFGGESNDPDTVFVRNQRMLTDFEVVKSEDPLPLHIRYGMGKEEFRANRASGLLRLRPEDE